MMRIRDVSLCVDVVGHGPPLVLMHGGPGADHHTMRSFRRLRDRFTLVFYDHRCNGRSLGSPVTSMTWENLAADADALRHRLGFERWAVLGHSFGGQVALEYALRYPDRLTHLVLADTGGDSVWSLRNAADRLAARGRNAEEVEMVRRWFNGEIQPGEMAPILMRIGDAYFYRSGLSLGMLMARQLMEGWRTKMRPEALMFAGRHLLPGWTVMDRLAEIHIPTLVIAGEDDFIFPPEHQQELAAGIPGAHLAIIERAGHNAHVEETSAVLTAVRDFLSRDTHGAPAR